MNKVKAQTALGRRVQGRQGEVATAARRVIARQGLAETTLRDIAREGGFTTGVLTHHFPDKRAVIFGTFASAWTEWMEESRQMFAAARTPRELVIALVDHAVPDSPEQRAEWRLWVEMWAYAGGDEEFAGQLLAADTAVWESELRRVLRSLRAAGLIRPDVRPGTEATIMNRLMDGLGVRAWLTGEWDEARRHFVLHLSSLGLPADLVEELLGPGSGGLRRRI